MTLLPFNADPLSPAGLPGLDPARATIVVVDDDATTLELVAGQLSGMGLQNVTCCQDSSQALELLDHLRPDVVLLDIFMPAIDGFTILQRLRATATHALLPVIILTAADDMATKVRALELGATDFLVKPVHYVELVPRIRNALYVKAYYDHLKQKAEELTRQVERQTASLKRSHDALEKANEVLRHSCEAAEAAGRAKSEFLARVSHELRTPLTSIIGFSEELISRTNSGCATTEHVEMLSTILRSARHLLEVVNDVLDVARIERNQLAIEARPCDPAETVREVAEVLAASARDKGLRFEVVLPAGSPRQIMTDPRRLRQILLNLVENAIKFTAEGFVRVAMRWHAPPDQLASLQIEVRDSGIGIDRAKHIDIFKPFVQACGTSAQYGGTGLGLTICRYLAEELGGRIDVESELGQGASFLVSLAANFLTLPAALPSTARGVDTPQPLAGIRLLLAEDDPDSQRLIRLVLQKAGASVVAVDDGQAALVAALAAVENGEPFALVVTDIQMPVLNGYELVARLRDANFAAPIMALTANAMVGEMEKCLAAGCDGYLTKPIDRVRLIAEVARLALSWSGAACTAPASVSL